MKKFYSYFNVIAALLSIVAAIIICQILDFFSDNKLTTTHLLIWHAVIFIISFISAYIYSAPFIIAAHKQHPQFWSIFILTIAGGWSGLFWLAALLWAVNKPDCERC